MGAALSCMYIWNAESSATAWLDQARCQQIMEANPDQIKVDLEQLLSLSLLYHPWQCCRGSSARERESKQRKGVRGFSEIEATHVILLAERRKGYGVAAKKNRVRASLGTPFFKMKNKLIFLRKNDNHLEK